MGNYELRPIHDNAKSFYRKAIVTEREGFKVLQSYKTNVAQIDFNYNNDGILQKKAVVFGTYSATTLRHIKEFLKQNGFEASSKKQIVEDYLY